MLPVLRAAVAPSTLETVQPPEAEAAAASAFLTEKNTMRAQIAARLAITKPLLQAPAEIELTRPQAHLLFAPTAGSEEVADGGYNQPLRNPPEIQAQGGRLDTVLEVKYGVNQLWSFKQNTSLPVWLRSYNGALVGPTLRLAPGDRLQARFSS